ncbi:M56 family metallopeptidase [Pedobacter frigoris]|uniref:M56 family metallopeptidase n=1 Tax=Pedobacter frigoris TaxID=2571272 RepID=A0A4U1CCE2_9SPHI|nr:M56 family metallopeptidase [Pedobacter frigoris]TKC02847.1 M56 family metallopeptidase [Pedobacter frigoris]
MEVIVNNLIKAIGWSIFHSLWQGAIIYGILLMLLSLFPKLNAGVKHNLAYGTLCLIFVGFCITFSSVFKLPEESQTMTAQILVEGNYTESVFTIPQQIKNSTEHIFPYLSGIYIIGLLSQLFILTVGYKKVLRLKQAARIAVPNEWQVVFSSMIDRLNIRRNISFYLSDKVNVPLVIGYLKPVVLFPVALATQLDIKQVEAILIHELSHIRRNDYLLNLIKTGIETLLFFNPFIWLTSKLIGVEREHACDDLVLKFTGTPLTYAHALLKLEILKDKTTPTLSMAATGNNQHLYQRIKRITDMKTNYMNAKQKFFAITLTMATVISLAWISPEKTTAASTKSQPPKNATLEVKSTQSKPLVKLVEIKPATGEKVPADTTKKKRKFKIVTIDAQGNQKEYNSVKEMPDSLRIDVIKDTFTDNDLNATFKALPADLDKALINFESSYNFKFDTILNSKQKGKMSPEEQKRLNSIRVELNKSIKAGTARSLSSSKELAEAYRKVASAASKTGAYTYSYKMKQNSDKDGDIVIMTKPGNDTIKVRGYSYKMTPKSDHVVTVSGIERAVTSDLLEARKRAVENTTVSLQRRLSSAEYKKEFEAMKEIRESEEYKKAKKKFDSEVEKMKRKKGIKTDSKTNINGLDIDAYHEYMLHNIEKP